MLAQSGILACLALMYINTFNVERVGSYAQMTRICHIVSAVLLTTVSCLFAMILYRG